MEPEHTSGGQSSAEGPSSTFQASMAAASRPSPGGGGGGGGGNSGWGGGGGGSATKSKVIGGGGSDYGTAGGKRQKVSIAHQNAFVGRYSTVQFMYS